MKSFLPWLFVLVGIVTASGCGEGASKPVAHLSGSITIAGEPIPENAEGSIMFRGTQSGQATANSVPIVGGRYDAAKVPKGPVKVFINVQQPTGRKISEAGGTPYDEYRSLVPAGYGKGIPLEVSADNANQNFDLTNLRKPGRR